MASYEESPPGNGLSLLKYKVDRNGRRLDRLEDWKGVIDADSAARKVRDQNMQEDIEGLRRSFDGLRSAIITFAFTIAGGTIITSLSVLLATGRL